MSDRDRAPLAPLRLTSLRSRIVASTVGLVVTVMLLVGTGTVLLLDRFAQRDIQNVLQDRASSVVAAASRASSTQLTVPPESVVPGALVYDATGHRVAGSMVPEVLEEADRLGADAQDRTVDAGEGFTLRAVPFVTASGVRGTVIVSLERTPYERSELYALLAMVALGLAVVTLTAVMARRATGQALAPVATMAERASEWSEHNLQQRFDLGVPTNELEALGETLDHLLDRVARAIHSEQRLTAELAHELRTPLTSIQGSADLALLRGIDDPMLRVDLEQISESARTMAATITALLDLARDPEHAPGGDTCEVADVVAQARELVPAPLNLVDATHGSRARIAAPVALVMRALAPLLDNAIRYAESRVTLSASSVASGVTIEVSDDGAGVDPDLREALFAPGMSGSGGTGLGLGIARRVARSLGGEIELKDSGEGATFALVLPRG